MKTPRLVTLVVTMTVVLGATPCEANWEDIWGIFDRLSGPGPFRAELPNVLTVRVACKRDGADVQYLWKAGFTPCWDSRTRDLEWYVAVHSPVSWTTNRGLFSDTEEARNRVRMIGITQVSLLFRWPPILREHRVFEWGPSIGLSRFSAEEADSFTRGTIDLPKYRVVPLGFLDEKSRWYRVFQLDGGFQAFWPGANQDDFCPPGRCAAPARPFETRFNLHPYLLVMFDLSEVLGSR